MKNIDWTELITHDNYKNRLQNTKRNCYSTLHRIRMWQEEGYRMGVYMFGQQIHETDPNNAIPFAQFKMFSKIQEYDVQKCLIFMGESAFHRIKRKVNKMHRKALKLLE